MISTASRPAEASELRPLLERLTREHFADFPLAEPEPGRVVAEFHESLLTSKFEPVVRAADFGIAGHQGVLHALDEDGTAVAPWDVFAKASSDDQLVQLDRLTRTVHALNYFRSQDPSRALFLNVEPRLLRHVAADHGAYFESILALLAIPPGRVVIVLPASAVDDPATFVRAAISYRIRGYRVLVPLRSARETDLAHLFLADPHYAAIDMLPSHVEGARVDEVRRLVQAFSRRGIYSMARRVQDEPQAQAARELGFGFMQGLYFKQADARP